MRLIDAIWFRLVDAALRIREEERGDSMVNWIVLAVGLAVAAAAIVAVLRPALEKAAQSIVNIVGS
jgi:hypothetical protein